MDANYLQIHFLQLLQLSLRWFQIEQNLNENIETEQNKEETTNKKDL